MKRKLSLIIVSLFIIVSVVALNTMSYAAISISSTAVSVKKGESKSVTLNGSGVTGTVSITSSNSNVATASGGNWIENNSVNISITGKSAGTATITVSGKVADSNTGNETTYSKQVSVTVTEATTGSNGTTTKNETTPSTNQKAETQKKSNNANLSNLGIRPNDFSGFKAGTTTYNVTVPKNVEEVEVYAKAQDSKSKVAGTGKKKLQEGKNTASVTVTAEDGTKKTYTINITRSATEEENNEEDVDDPEADDNNETDTTEAKGLSELKIGNLELSPTFRTDIYEYTAKYIGEDTKLEVSTITTEDDYTIEITGNDDLKEGENIITILVSDAEGNNVATYQVTVNKSLAQETLPENQDENGMKILGIIVGIIIVVIIIFLIIRHRRNKKWEEEYSTSFSRLGDDDEEDNVYKNQLEDFDENMKPTKRKEIRDSHQDKKAAKEEYLNNFNSNNDEYPEWQEEAVKKRRTKGKRFK